MSEDAGFNGTRWLLLVNTGTPSVPQYEPVGSQRDGTVDENTEMIDYSSKLSRARRVGPGRYSTDISLEALYVPDSDSYQALKDAMRNGEYILVAKEEDDVAIETIDAVVLTLSESYPDQDASTVSISLAGDGEWQTVGS